MGRLGASVARRGPHHPRGEAPIQRHQHHRPRDQPLTQDSELLHDTKHLSEDTRALSREALDAMSPEELEFHYFSAHDFDRNNKLDGLELLKAVYHTMEHQYEGNEEPLDLQYNDIDAYIELVDRTLKSDDTDGDGYVSYAEYRAVRARRPRPLDRAPASHDAGPQDQGHDSPSQGHNATQQDPASSYQSRDSAQRAHEPGHDHARQVDSQADQPIDIALRAQAHGYKVHKAEDVSSGPDTEPHETEAPEVKLS